MDKKIYLALPFTGLEDLSFMCANEVAALLIEQEYYVYSPISMSYPIWSTKLCPHTFEVWLRQDEVFVNWADEIWLINIMGEGFYENGEELIKKSKGCQQEIEWAKQQEKPMHIIDYDFTHKKIYQIREYE